MIKASCVSLIIAALLLAISLMAGTSQSFADDKDKERPAVSPEMKVLNKRVGTWNTVYSGKATDWTPKAFEAKGVEKIELVMHGRFIEGKVRTQPGDLEATWLATYDSGKQAYRVWYFNSQGDISEGTGKWDSKTNTMTWNSEPQPGIVSVAQWRFLSDDTFEWDMVAKDRNDKIYLDIAGKLTRKK
jgi:hypothetical protein